MSFIPTSPWGRSEDHAPEHHEPVVEEVSKTEEVEVEEEEAKEPKKAPARKRTPRLTGPQVKLVAEKTLELVEADPEDLELAATVLGTKANVDEMVVEIFANAGLPPAMKTLIEMESGDAFEATGIAVELSRADLRKVWALAIALGADLPERAPNGLNASMDLARAVRNMDKLAPRFSKIEALIGK